MAQQKLFAFRDREDAGKKLAARLIAELKKKKIHPDIVLAIPRGGVPVGYEVAKVLRCSLDVIIPRKLPIPTEPEAGFGAVINNTVILNRPLLKILRLSEKEIQRTVKEVRQEIARRIKIYRGSRPYPKLEGKTVIVVDDGLASGYTMLAAIKWLKSKGAKPVVAVPVSSESASREVGIKAKLICLHVSHARVFAVADSYEVWHDLSDEEVIDYLKKATILHD